jgi:hypothetical protein
LRVLASHRKKRPTKSFFQAGQVEAFSRQIAAASRNFDTQLQRNFLKSGADARRSVLATRETRGVRENRSLEISARHHGILGYSGCGASLRFFVDFLEKNRADGLTKKVPTGALIRVFGSVYESYLEAVEAETAVVTAQATRLLSF